MKINWCYFRLLFIQYNVACQYQSLTNLSLPYQYTSQGKMGTAGLDESCWILSWVSNFLSTVITMIAPRPTLTPVQWMLFYSPWGSSSHILYMVTHFNLAPNLKTSGVYHHGPSVLFLLWWLAVGPTLFLVYIIERLWILWSCSPYFSPSWLYFILFSLNQILQQLVLTCKKWGTDTISYKQILHITLPHDCTLKHK